MSSFETHVVHPDSETRNETETGFRRLEMEDHRTESADSSKPMIELRIVDWPDGKYVPPSLWLTENDVVGLVDTCEQIFKRFLAERDQSAPLFP